MTERAHKALDLSLYEAGSFVHGYVGTEHILLGLLREGEGLAAHVLKSHGITVQRVRDQVAQIVGRGVEAPPGQIPFTPRAKKVISLSLREALGLGHNYIGTEHILLALVREAEGVAPRILLDLGLSRDEVRAAVLRTLGEPTRHARSRPPVRIADQAERDLVTPANVTIEPGAISAPGWIERPLDAPKFSMKAADRFYADFVAAAGKPVLTTNEARAHLNLSPLQDLPPLRLYRKRSLLRRIFRRGYR